MHKSHVEPMEKGRAAPQLRKGRSTAGLKRTKSAATDHPAQREELRGAANAADNGRQDRLSMISDAAYFLAAKRDFSPGHELDDWLAAEREIDSALAAASGVTSCG
jgi:hypothetical protein